MSTNAYVVQNILAERSRSFEQIMRATGLGPRSVALSLLEIYRKRGEVIGLKPTRRRGTPPWFPGASERT